MGWMSRNGPVWNDKCKMTNGKWQMTNGEMGWMSRTVLWMSRSCENCLIRARGASIMHGGFSLPHIQIRKKACQERKPEPSFFFWFLDSNHFSLLTGNVTKTMIAFQQNWEQTARWCFKLVDNSPKCEAERGLPADIRALCSTCSKFANLALYA